MAAQVEALVMQAIKRPKTKVTLEIQVSHWRPCTKSGWQNNLAASVEENKAFNLRLIASIHYRCVWSAIAQSTRKANMQKNLKNGSNVTTHMFYQPSASHMTSVQINRWNLAQTEHEHEVWRFYPLTIIINVNLNQKTASSVLTESERGSFLQRKKK